MFRSRGSFAPWCAMVNPLPEYAKLPVLLFILRAGTLSPFKKAELY